MSDDRQRAEPRRKRWIVRAALLGICVIGLVLGWLLSPSCERAYLDLQAGSDAAHRMAVLWLPVSAVAFLFFWPIARVFEEFVWIRRVSLTVMTTALAFGSGLASYIVSFDRGIEQAGLRGQFEIFAAGKATTGGAGGVLGPFHEGKDGPGIASDALPDGDYLTLDKRTLSRRTSSGGYRWSRKRGGLWPAWLVVTPARVLLAMPSGKYPDDMILAAVDLESGRWLFDFHCLGNRMSAPRLSGDRLAFTIARHSNSAVYLLDPAKPELAWSRFLPRITDLPPRLKAASIEVAQGGSVVSLDIRDGHLQESRPVCADPAAAQVACRAGRVIAWLEREGE